MSSGQSVEEIRGWFGGRVTGNRTTPGYRTALALVAVLMVLLPLVYLSIIGLVGYATYLYAANSTGILATRTSGRGYIGVLIAYFGPIVGGLLLIGFLIKPLFARQSGNERQLTLRRDQEPRLFGFVDLLCDAVGAPRPREIAIDCQVNASASLRRGWLSLFGGDLRLTIGLPLAAGLDVRQFAGVLAHEFGHFSQGAGMRLTYVIRSINYWFVRVVYERDAWDATLDEWCRDGDIRTMILAWAFRACVWVSRRVLWCLMWVGNVASCLLLRQMEFDADRYETRLAGSDTFASTSWQLNLLNLASQGATSDLRELFREGRLVDDYPRLVTVNVEQIPAEFLATYRKSVDEAKTGWFDTHPADTARVAAARDEHAGGVFHGTGPAAQLFSDFVALSRQASAEYYREMLGSAYESVTHCSVDQLRDKQQQQKAASESAERFFLGQFSPLRSFPWPAGYEWLRNDLPACHAKLKQTRERIQTLLGEYQQQLTQHRQWDDHWVEGHIAVALHHARVRVKPENFKQRVQTLNDALTVRGAAAQQLEASAVSMAEFERCMVERLTADLALLVDPIVNQKCPHVADWESEAGRLLAVLAKLGQQVGRLLELRNLLVSTDSLVSHLDQQQQNASFQTELREKLDGLKKAVNEFGRGLGNAAYPFEHAQGEISLASYICGTWPVGDDPSEAYNAAQSILERLPNLQWRVVTRLAEIGEQVEQALGYEPLVRPSSEVAT